MCLAAVCGIERTKEGLAVVASRAAEQLAAEQSTPEQLASEQRKRRMLPVIERFISINGEGQFAGMLSAFIRFPGCNLCCAYCDTAWANEMEISFELLSIEDIVSYIKHSGVRHVTLTGGEPTLQPALADLLEELVRVRFENGEGLVVEVETNGSIDLTPFVRQRETWQEQSMYGRWFDAAPALARFSGGDYNPGDSDVDGKELARMNREKQAPGRVFGTVCFTMDYKLPSSGMEARMCVRNFKALSSVDTVKFVAGSRQDLQRMREVMAAFDLGGVRTASDAHDFGHKERNEARPKVYVGPVFGRLDPQDLVVFMKEHQLNQVVLQLQLHKIIWPKRDRGV